MNIYSECPSCGETLPVALGGLEQTVMPCCAAGIDHAGDAVKALAGDAVAPAGEPRLLDSALWYAQKFGWPVFPLVPGGKTPATRNGFKDATTSKSVIVQWWQDAPNYNIGLPTGGLFDCVDVDMPDGAESWSMLRDSGHMPDIHGWAATPSGGWHVFVQATGAGNTTAAYPNVDYRGAGGYVVAPPSVRDGRQYRWSVRPSPAIKNGTPA